MPHMREYQCSKLLPVRQPEADKFGGGPGTFFKLFFNVMFMILDSRQQDWQLFFIEFWTLGIPWSKLFKADIEAIHECII